MTGLGAGISIVGETGTPPKASSASVTINANVGNAIIASNTETEKAGTPLANDFLNQTEVSRASLVSKGTASNNTTASKIAVENTGTPSSIDSMSQLRLSSVGLIDTEKVSAVNEAINADKHTIASTGESSGAISRNLVGTATTSQQQADEMKVDQTIPLNTVFGNPSYADVAGDVNLIVAVVDMSSNEHFAALGENKFGKLISAMNTMVLSQIGELKNPPGFEDSRLAGGAMRVKCRYRITRMA